MDCKLSILIPSLTERSELFARLYDKLQIQMVHSVQILSKIDNKEMTIGAKRNWLLERSIGEYVCFIDDDDEPSSNYIETILKGIEKKPDCISLKGVITWDGENPEIFEHSIKYFEYSTTTNSDVKYERYPNHLNAIKSSIAKQFKFPEINHGEDTDWATQIFKSGLIKTEYYVNEVLYHYKYSAKK